MRRYRTEILIPADRHIHIQLPDQWPEGLARLIIEVVDPEPAQSTQSADREFNSLDSHDMEWWEEFDEEADRPDSFCKTKIRKPFQL